MTPNERAEPSTGASSATICGLAVASVDRDGRVLGWSPSAVGLLGHPADAVVGRSITELFAVPLTASRRAVVRRGLFDRREVVTGTRAFRRADGRVLVVEMTGIPLLDAEGVVARVELVLVVPTVRAGAIEDRPRLDTRVQHLVDRCSLDACEREILELLATGHRVATIARRLHYAPGTVRNRLSGIYAKVGVAGQIELVEVLTGDRDPIAGGGGRERRTGADRVDAARLGSGGRLSAGPGWATPGGVLYTRAPHHLRS